VYAPLTVALIVFGVVGMIVLATCYIYWRRHRPHDRSTTLQRTKSYRAPASSVLVSETPPLGTHVKAHHNISKEDAFSHAVSPVQPNMPVSNKWPLTLEGGR
jgi:hypothetical protein